MEPNTSEDGVDRASTQEPYLQIVAPNLDQISPDVLDASTYNGKRARRGLRIAMIAIGATGLIAATGILVQTLHTS